MTSVPLFSPDPQFLSRTLAACSVGLVITDVCQFDQPVVYVNPAFEALSGYTADEILGRNCRFLQAEDRDQSGVEEIRQAIAQGQSITVTLRNYRKNGTLFYNELTLSPVHDASGTLTHYLGFQNDVTEREAARRQLTSTLERVADGFLSFDQHWNLSYVNPAAAAMLEKAPNEFIGRNLLEAFPPSVHRPIGQVLQQARATGRAQSEVSFVAEVGRWLEATAYPAEDGAALLIRDITQHSRTSEEGFARLFEAAPVAIVVSQLSPGKILDVNPKFVRQSGYSREDVIGRTQRDLNVWVDPLELEDIEQTLQGQGKILNREVQLRRKSGEVADAVVSVVPVRLGGEACVLTLLRDVTSEKHALRQLEDSEARYRQSAEVLQRTLDLSMDMITTTDPSAKVISVSAACERLLGYQPGELIGRSLLDFVHPDDLDRTQAEVVLIKTRLVPIMFQNRYCHKDGHVVWMEWNTFLVPGDPLLYSVGRDITQRKAAEEDQAFLAAIVEASNNAIVGVDLTDTIRSWNAGAERLYGYTAAETVGQPITLIIPPELRAESAEAFSKVMQGERVEAFESVRIAKDGRRVPVIVTVSPVLDATGKVIGVARTTRDITALQAAERQVYTLNQHLEAQLRHVTGLWEIDQAIASSQDLSVTLGMILDNVAQQLGADAVTLLLLDPQTLSLEYVGTRGFTAPLQGTAVKLGSGLAGEVALSRRALNVPDVQGTDVLPAWRDVLTRERLMAYYGVPLISKGKVLGVIEVLHREPFHPSATWLSTFEMLTAQAAIAVDNAQLFAELERRNLELRLAYDETIEGWSRALDLRDHETEGHSRRVTEMTVNLCQRLAAPPEQLVHVRRGALLHDIGKMGIRDAVLLKPEPLSDEEWVEMRKHPGHAVKLLSPIEFLRPAMDIPQYHHEKWDGSGYPLGLSGKAIPLMARAFAVVDVYDALTSDRPYRKAWSREQALEHIQNSAGTHFDPAVVRVFVHMLEQSER
ncbi:PAS domain S-box protein [Deinococcus alpinitundrae]|uniref:PAS domain S-box protein n=1 Tax=Deinococcus alpinitundrae TaxID=468913 RepID=UPI00137B595A|nr:PAS domain S-box protein [Deinococcus alpinitundrae]